MKFSSQNLSANGKEKLLGKSFGQKWRKHKSQHGVHSGHKRFGFSNSKSGNHSDLRDSSAVTTREPPQNVLAQLDTERPLENYSSKKTNLLPIQECKDRLVQEFGNYHTFIIVGETGSGKSTQIPQIILDSSMNKKKCIAITQPRRIAAISLARRVAEERGQDVGSLVGYSVRFEDASSDSTRIKYLTDGMLLREAMVDSRLLKYSWIILDEAHERTISTDILFGVVKRAQIMRNQMKSKKRLKIVLMSATMDVTTLEKFYPHSRVLYARGREHSVQIHYLRNEAGDMESASNVVKTVFQLHQSVPPDQHILVFLTGQDEIESTAFLIKKLIQANRITDLSVSTLYGALPYELQADALQLPQPGIRKCILSTNIAETSLTIPGIRIVIDSGKVKIRLHLKGTCINGLAVVPISKAQAWQRSGRAGRVAAGSCYRLYTPSEFEKMSPYSIPEIQRSSMTSVVLQLLKIGMTSPLAFEWLEKPNTEVLQDAVKTLTTLGALKSTVEPLELTEIGDFMSRIPLEPILSKVIYQAQHHGVVEPIITVLSILTSENLMVTTKTNDKISGLKGRFRSPEGDLIAYLKIYREYANSSSKQAWCKANGLNYRALQFASKVRKQLIATCSQSALPLTSTLSGSLINENIRKCFYESLPTHTAFLQEGNHYSVKLPGHAGILSKIHPTSALAHSRAPFVSFCDMLQVSKSACYLCHVSLVNPEWVSFK